MLVANSKVAALEAALAARSVEQVQLRRHLHAARQALDPHIIQARVADGLTLREVQYDVPCLRAYCGLLPP